ncbi:3738_t:CDS:2 [Acaulospora morrowiae]|uniref:3738_t:CDS:1 n=1 Tax=Acaulospora morrowiae TaxID=94023 RepID=A0A9N8WK04_9GLOM|nr:3738_t:CDS:2 [Acaulospora morrowiae]
MLSKKPYSRKGYVRKAILAKGVVNNKLFVTGSVVKNYRAEREWSGESIFHSFLCSNARVGTNGKVYVKGFRLKVSLGRNMQIFLPPQGANQDPEQIWEVPLKIRIAILSHANSIVNFRGPPDVRRVQNVQVATSESQFTIYYGARVRATNDDDILHVAHDNDPAYEEDEQQQILKKSLEPEKQKADDLALDHFLNSISDDRDLLLFENYKYNPVEDLRL